MNLVNKPSPMSIGNLSKNAVTANCECREVDGVPRMVSPNTRIARQCAQTFSHVATMPIPIPRNPFQPKQSAQISSAETTATTAIVRCHLMTKGFNSLASRSRPPS